MKSICGVEGVTASGIKEGKYGLALIRASGSAAGVFTSNLVRAPPIVLMEERIRRKNWSFEHDISFNRLSLRYRGKIFIKKYLGINTYYENYRLV